MKIRPKIGEIMSNVLVLFAPLSSRPWHVNWLLFSIVLVRFEGFRCIIFVSDVCFFSKLVVELAEMVPNLRSSSCGGRNESTKK